LSAIKWLAATLAAVTLVLVSVAVFLFLAAGVAELTAMLLRALWRPRRTRRCLK
jgi:hypothetical protein